MRILFLDCFSGVSGDMTVGALLDAGADFDTIRRALESLGVAGLRVTAEKAAKHGIACTRFQVFEDGLGLTHEPTYDHGHEHHHDHHHEHDHDHHHAHTHKLELESEPAHQPHRNLRDVTAIIECGELPAPVKAEAIATFRRLAEAEAAVHGTTLEAIHFHEVGAVDAIADIVAANLAKHLLNVEAVYASPIHVGGGTVTCAHGVLPVPAPATARLLEGMPLVVGGAPGELATPTGAALLAQWGARFDAPPAMRIEAIGYGGGTRDIPGRANVLRASVATVEGQESSAFETIAVLETLVDDMNPEFVPPLLETLLAHGARDAWAMQALGKKGRPALRLSVLADPGKTGDVLDILFHNTTTLGVRMREERRATLERRWESVETPWGAVRVKVGAWRGADTNALPEFEDCRKIAEAHGVPVKRVYEAAVAAYARKGE